MELPAVRRGGYSEGVPSAEHADMKLTRLFSEARADFLISFYCGIQGDERGAQHDMAAALAGSVLTLYIAFAPSVLPKAKANPFPQ